MKNQGFKMAVLLLIFSFVFVTCKKDVVDKKGQIIYNGSEYELAKGYLNYWGLETTNHNSYLYDIILVSSKITMDYSQQLVSGIGHGIEFEFFSSSQNDIVPGTYVFDEKTYNANTFGWSDVYLNYDFSTFNKASSALEVIAGNVEVVKFGSEYEITCNCTVTGGKTVTIYFKGSLEYHDMSSSNKIKEDKSIY
jgi:hypothetical protein